MTGFMKENNTIPARLRRVEMFLAIITGILIICFHSSTWLLLFDAEIYDSSGGINTSYTRNNQQRRQRRRLATTTDETLTVKKEEDKFVTKTKEKNFPL